MSTHLYTGSSMAMVAGFLLIAGQPSALAASVTEALTNGNAKLDVRLRYESAEQDNALADADALTLRTRLGYTTGEVEGWSGTFEFEDNRIVLGQGDYSVGPSGYNPGQFSVIADPEFTELDQGFIQYKNDMLRARMGRQVVTMDNHRFIGHVGWRQDRQTFDAFSLAYTPMADVSLNYVYIDQRNRIFGQDADLDAKDHLFNAAYQTRYGKLVGYAYLLEVDNGNPNGLDTYGVRFSGAAPMEEIKLLYTLEFASQSNETASTDFDTDYTLIEIGANISGVTAKLGYEVLGSDNGSVGFATPLATLHKFNGWADVFLVTPSQGLVDTYLSVGGSLAGGNWLVVYHDFEADEGTATVDDLGSELDLQYTRKLSEHFQAGIKYAAYSADGGRVDTDRLWAWVSASF